MNYPVKHTDPSGHCFFAGIDTLVCITVAIEVTGVSIAVIVHFSGVLDPAAESIAQGIREGGRRAVSFVEETIIKGSTETYPLGLPPNPCTIPRQTLKVNTPTIYSTPLNEPVTFGLEFPSTTPVQLPTIYETSGIYEFPDSMYPGKTYVGQSGNIEGRLKRHEEAGRYTPGTGSMTPMPESTKFEREIAEQNRINDLGGIGSGNVSNKRNPIGPARREEALKRGLNPFP